MPHESIDFRGPARRLPHVGARRLHQLDCGLIAQPAAVRRKNPLSMRARHSENTVA
jgi:hypothetical protein